MKLSGARVERTLAGDAGMAEQLGSTPLALRQSFRVPPSAWTGRLERAGVGGPRTF